MLYLYTRENTQIPLLGNYYVYFKPQKSFSFKNCCRIYQMVLLENFLAVSINPNEIALDDRF